MDYPFRTVRFEAAYVLWEMGISFLIPPVPYLYAMPIEALRAEINRIDFQIIDLIAERQKIAGKIAQVKMNEGIPIHDIQRTQEVTEYSFNAAVERNINPVYIRKIFDILIEMSEERQRECSGEGNLP
jgi:chorismate mutase